MEKEYVNEQALNIDGEAFEAAMKAYMEDKGQDKLIAFMEALNKATFLVPVDFPKDIAPEVLQKMQNGEPLQPDELPRMVPVIFTNKAGNRLAPAFSSRAQLPEEMDFKAILPVDFKAVLQVAMAEDVNAKGILINPNTTRLILNPNLLTLMQKVVAGEDVETVLRESGNGNQGQKEIRMTQDQFHVFIRRNMEVGIIPKKMFADKDKFMEELEEKREEMILEIYRSAYNDPVPFPYTENDFDVMMLDISDTLSVASIGLPTKNMAPGTCTSVYVVRNPQTNEMRYYTIERTQEEDASKLGQVLEDGTYNVIGDAPAPGCEISGILEMLQAEG